MTVPKIKKGAGGTSGSGGQASLHENGDNILPFKTVFTRAPEEQIRVMFETTDLMVQSDKQPSSLLTKILIFVAFFLAALFVFQWLERSHVSIWKYGGVLIGFGAGVLLLGLWILFYQGRTMREFEKRLKGTVMCEVEIDEAGIHSSATTVELNSKWHDVDDILIRGECLLLIDEVWVHYVPVRALPAGLTLSALEAACKKQQMMAGGNPI